MKFGLPHILVSLAIVTACAEPSSPRVVPTKRTVQKPDTGKPTNSGNSTPNTDGTSTTPDTPSTPSTPVDPKDTTTTNPPTGTPGTTDPVVPTKPDQTPTTNVNLVGGIDPNNSFIRVGEVTGWAVDKANLSNYLTVNLYFDGDNKTGKKAGTVKANLVGSDEGNGGEHAFIFYVPKEMIDSKPHKVYGYAVMDGVEVPLSAKMPYTLTFYKPKGGAAQTLYSSIGFETKCGSCHSGAFNYQNRWEKLIGEGFTGKPWGAETNYLYEKVTTSHRNINGGKPCNLINCAKIIEWWKAEFQ